VFSKSDFENTMLSTGQELLTQRFNRPGKTNISEKYKDIDYYSTGKVKNSVLRRVHSKNTHRRNINSEPPRDERRKETVRTILEPPSPETRGFLENLYGGKCQICQKTFPERDGKPFFIASHIIERKHGRFLDNYANALCLCPEHFAKWCHGSVEAPDIDELIMSFKTEAEGGDGNRKISVKLCGENCQIIYKEKHLLDLQELLRELSREDKIK